MDQSAPCPACGHRRVPALEEDGSTGARVAAGSGSGGANMALVLGVLSIVGCACAFHIPTGSSTVTIMGWGMIPGFIAVSVGNRARTRIESGEADVASLGVAKAAVTCASVGIALNVLAFIVGLVL